MVTLNPPVSSAVLADVHPECFVIPAPAPELVKWGNTFQFSSVKESDKCRHTAKVFVFLASRTYTFEAIETLELDPRLWDWNLIRWDERVPVAESFSAEKQMIDCVNSKTGISILSEPLSSWNFAATVFSANQKLCKYFIRGNINQEDNSNRLYNALLDISRDADGSRQRLYGSTDVEFFFYQQSDSDLVSAIKSRDESRLSGFKFQWGSWDASATGSVAESADQGVSLVLEDSDPAKNVFPYVPDPVWFDPTGLYTNGKAYEGRMVQSAFDELLKLYQQGL